MCLALCEVLTHMNESDWGAYSQWETEIITVICNNKLGSEL